MKSAKLMQVEMEYFECPYSPLRQFKFKALTGKNTKGG